MDLETKVKKANFENILSKKGYAYFTKGTYNLNIIGIRSNARTNNNVFDDFIVIEYCNSKGKKCKDIYPITTNPGTYYLKTPMNNKGCAILVLGQYRGCWTIGKHKGQYEALVQRKPIKVYRDNNKDSVLDCTTSPVEEGIFGVNIHKAGVNSVLVNNWSAGCQVFKKSADFYNFMTLCKLQTKAGFGSNFTYTLIDEKDLELD